MKRYLASAGSALAIVAFGALTLAACRLESPPKADEKTAEARAGCDGDDGHGRFCGGFGGIQCPPGLVCEDDPSDDCDPDRGGADCGGVCVPGDGDDDCDSPDREYVSRDPGWCQAIFFRCDRGEVPFFDACGCGCESSGSDGIPCGDDACRQGEFCCNPSCGICAPLGGSCILIDCD